MPNAETLSRGLFAKISSLLCRLFVINYPTIGKQNTERMKAMATTKTVNYTEEMTAQLHNLYAELGNEGLDKIAETIGSPSVRFVQSSFVTAFMSLAKRPRLQKRTVLLKRNC